MCAHSLINWQLRILLIAYASAARQRATTCWFSLIQILIIVRVWEPHKCLPYVCIICTHAHISCWQIGERQSLPFNTRGNWSFCVCVRFVSVFISLILTKNIYGQHHICSIIWTLELLSSSGDSSGPQQQYKCICGISLCIHRNRVTGCDALANCKLHTN